MLEESQENATPYRKYPVLERINPGRLRIIHHGGFERPDCHSLQLLV